MSAKRAKIISFLFVFVAIIFIVTLVIIEDKNYSKIDTTSYAETNVLSIATETDRAAEIEKPSDLDFRDSLIDFAKQQLLVPYKYASCDPEVGFDCSGFVFYVFQQFNIQTPRSSSAFLSAGKAKELYEAEKGDVLVFTGTDANRRVGGHVGIVLSTDSAIEFIHSSSGNAMGVTISSLEEPNYKKRYLGLRDYIAE